MKHTMIRLGNALFHFCSFVCAASMVQNGYELFLPDKL